MARFHINVVLTFDEEIESDGDRNYKNILLEQIHVEHYDLAGFDEDELQQISETLAQVDRYQIALTKIGNAIQGEVINP